MSHNEELLAQVTRIADAQERIADADELRNELLIKDAEERRNAWNQEIELREQQLRQIMEVPE